MYAKAKTISVQLVTVSLMLATAVFVPHGVMAKDVSLSQVTQTCLSEAAWPVAQSPNYRNGSIRQKQQLKNAYNAEVSAVRLLCHRLEKAKGADRSGLAQDCLNQSKAILNTHGERARDHVQRLKDICLAYGV